jgi:pimeloyl-ACP methyl ester carboxylesterase
MANVEERTGRLSSGDVTLFYRLFGRGGATPILVLHGSNYYDSYDWIPVAAALASDREVVVPDRRGWGESTWSPSKDYSRDALIDDMLAVMRTLRWEKAIVMGHSGGGPTVISFAAHFPNQTAKLVIVDSQMNRDEDAGSGQTVGNAPLVFPSIEAAMARFARLNNPPRIGVDQERATHALIKVDNGYMLKRDPDNGNKKPIGEGAALPRRQYADMWTELKGLRCPVMLVRGLRSDRYKPADLERIARELPNIRHETVDSQHDVPRMAPDALVAHVKSFIATS